MSVVHLHEKQTLRWHGDASCFSVFGLKDSFNVFSGDFSFGVFEESANEISNHLVEETICFKLEPDASRFFDGIESKQCAHRVFGGAATIGVVSKGSEVARSEEVGAACGEPYAADSFEDVEAVRG